MFLTAFKQALDVILRKPIRLWGLSLLCALITGLANIGFFAIPILATAIVQVLKCGMAKIYLDGLDGEEVNSDQLFEGFSRFMRVAGGSLWVSLWIFIWALIPIAGPIMAIIKMYQYKFVPYILMTQPEVKATQAIRLSMELTEGKRGAMFLADLIFIGGSVLVSLALSMFAAIPVIGILFGLLGAVFALLFAAFNGIFKGLYSAAFYKMPKVQAYNYYQQNYYQQQGYQQGYQQPYQQGYQQPYQQQGYQGYQQPYQQPQAPMDHTSAE